MDSDSDNSDNHNALQRERIDSHQNDSDIPLRNNVEVIMPNSNVQQPNLFEPILPIFLQPEANAIYPQGPQQGILGEPEKPILHHRSGEKLFPVTFHKGLGKRKRDDTIWKEFTFFKCKQDNLYALCLHCRSHIFRAEARQGTSSPTRHLAVCSARKVNVSRDSNLRSNKSTTFCQQTYVSLMADAIMMHEYPFLIVEHEGLRRVHNYLNENVQTISRNTIQKVCVLKHEEFKVKIKEMFGALTSKICLTSDIWTACTSRSYLTLTAHYVDAQWNLRSKVLNFVHFPPPHIGLLIFALLDKLIKDWGIEKKVMSLTLDNATNNDNMITYLKASLLEHLPCFGKYFHIRCAAHILNLVVSDGMGIIKECLLKIRATVKYIDSSEGRMIKFYICAGKCGLPTNTKLWMDVSTRWNSTYMMLKRALFFRTAIDMFSAEESGFMHCLSAMKWLKVEKICNLLEPFYEITTIFSGSEYPTANLYFYNMWKIQLLLISAKEDLDAVIKAMAIKMDKKFEKYWRLYSHVLCFAVILDPRYKFDFVLFALIKLKGHEAGTRLANEMNLQFIELFKYYEQRAPKDASSNVGDMDFRLSDLEEFDANYGSSSKKNSSGFEYQRYFDEAKEPRTVHMDVLSFWAKRVDVFPVLSTMAKDILAIPITTVASESTFSMGGRVLNKWRSSLLSKNVEALVTTRNWLFGYEDLEALGIEVDDSNCDDDEDLVA